MHGVGHLDRLRNAEPRGTVIDTTMDRTRASERGFTLIELLIVLTVTVIGMIGMLSLLRTTTHGNQIASRSARAGTIAAWTIEDLRSLGFNELTTRFGPLPIATTLPTVDDGNNRTYRPGLTVTDLGGGLYRIRVDVRWTEQGALPGSNNGRYDHNMAVEIIRNQTDFL